MKKGLSYDEVLLQPGYSETAPDQADTRVSILPQIVLNVPLISAAMDMVTEQKMAIAMALVGGVGVIHRNLSPRQQAKQVKAVKRYLNWIIDEPVTISADSCVRDVAARMYEHQISGMLVVDDRNRLLGIVTGRDLRFCRDNNLQVSEVMTKNPHVVSGDISREQVEETFNRYKIEKLPVVDQQNHLRGLITARDMAKTRSYPSAATDTNGRLLAAAAISPFDWQKRMPLLTDNKVDFVVFDTAHGDTAVMVEAIKEIKKNYTTPLVAGNVVSAEATRRLIEAGADSVKVGVGPGSICTTRVVTGVGMPQFSAVLECAEAAKSMGKTVIADGGIKFSGDIVKALAAGAEAVMIGNLFAGLKESPGDEIYYEGRMFKSYRGMGSVAAIKEGSGDRYQVSDNEEPVPEGIEGRVPYRGELDSYVHQLAGGIKKGMYYCGVSTIAELQNYRRFTQISAAGWRESHSHDVSITREAPNYHV